MSEDYVGLPAGHRFHHVGVPVEHRLPGMRYLAHLKLAVVGYETSPYHYEWMHFDTDCPLPDLVKTRPHVCFQVDDLDAALQGREILIAPNSPSPGIRVAFIVHDGAPIELLEDNGCEPANSGSTQKDRSPE
jgi:hypothetical protein